MNRRLRHLLISLTLAFAPGPVGGAWFGTTTLPGIAVATLLTLQPAAAQSTRRSGGYGLPGSGGSFSTPSRRPSVPFTGSGGRSSGGYRTPSYRAVAPPPSRSGGDQAITRQNSGQALQQYRAGQAAPAQRRPSTGSSNPWTNPGTRRPSAGWDGSSPGISRSVDADRRGYPAYVPTQRFGMWDGLLLWGLLNSLNQPGHSQFFYSNQDDPAYRQWRTQMDKAAAQDPAIREKLNDLDGRLGQLQGQPKTPGVLPPDVPAMPAAPEPDDMGGGAGVWIVLLLGGGLLLLLWYRRQQSSRPAGTPRAPAALGGSAQTRFRVGMTFPMDPTPFVLAAVNTKVTAIKGEMVSVEAVGVLMDQGIPLHRLYLPGREAFFQMHLSRDGTPDECRYFSRLDEISPASQQEWGVWLDPGQGLIGWPQFETRDGRIYDRVWAPGRTRIPPRELAETIQELDGTRNRVLQAMLYGAPTGARAPAPQTEYVLVAAVEDARQTGNGQAWVEIHVGIDINPASLTLPAVPLA